jgi:hypothetical protein
MPDRVSTLSIVGQLDLSGAREALAQLRAEAASNPISIGTGGGTGRTFGGQTVATGPSNAAYVSTGALASGINGASGNSFGGGGSSFNFNSSNTSFNSAAVTINQAASSFTAAVANFQSSISVLTNTVNTNIANTTATSNAVNNTSNVTNNIVNGGGGSGGGGGGTGSRNFFSRGFGRTVSAFFLTREILSIAQGEQDYQNELGLAGPNDQRATLKAMLARRQQLFQVPIVGQLASFASDWGGYGGGGLNAIRAQERSNDAGEGVQTARLAFQAYERDVNERGDIAATPVSQRRLMSSLQDFDAEQRRRREEVGKVTAADLRKRDEAIAGANREYDEFANSWYASLPGPLGGVNALSDYQRRTKRDEDIDQARKNYTTAVGGLNADVPSGTQLPVGRGGSVAVVADAMRDLEQQNRAALAEGVRAAAVAAATGEFAGTIAAGGGGPNYAAQRRFTRATNAASEYETLETKGFGAFAVQASTDRAKEQLEDAHHNVQLEDERISRRGRLDENAAVLAGQPLEARLARIRSSRDRALLRLDANDISGRVDVWNESFGNEAVERRNFGYQAGQIRTTLGGQREALLSGLRREPGAAGEAFTMAASGLNQVSELRQQGRSELAVTAGQNSVLGLQLLQQQFFDAFRGVQVDPRMIATQGGRASEDPGTVSDAIDKGIERIVAAIKDVVDNAGG